MVASYQIASLTTSFASNKCMIGIFNPASSNQVVRVYRIYALNNQLVNVTGVLTNLEVRRLSACSGGTTIIPTRHDTSSTNLYAGGATLTNSTQTITNMVYSAGSTTITFSQPAVPTVSAASWANNVITITTSGSHGYQIGQWVTISASNPSGYNGTYCILQVPSTTTFIVAQATNPGTYTSSATLTAGHSYQSGQQISIAGVTPSQWNKTAVPITSLPANNQVVVTMSDPGVGYTSGGSANPAILAGTNQSFTPTSLYRRVLWSTDEPSNASGTAAATVDEFQTFLPFGTIWSMGYADTTTEPITLRAGEGVGVINTGGSVGAADFFMELTVASS